MAEGRNDGGVVPFWAHQVVEYLFGVVAFLCLARVEPRSAGLCAGAGAALLLLPGLSGGRVGVARLISPRLHRVVDYAAVPLLATSPWWSGVGWGAGGVWVVEALAVAMLWLARSTSYRRHPTPAPSAAAPERPSSAAIQGGARAAGRVVGAVGRKGPRAAGVAVGRIKKRRSGPPSSG